ITNKAQGLTYILTNVTMWATQTGSFSNYVNGNFKCDSGSQQSGDVICEYYDDSDSILAELTSASPSYTVPGSGDWMNFSYNQVPIIWANATFKLIKDSSAGWDFSGSKTLNDTNATYGSNFIVVEKIYIIGTYLVKVTKHVLYNSTASTDTNVFDIYLVVENIGGEESPYVYVYDLIPDNFEKYQWNGWTDDSGGDWVKLSGMLAGDAGNGIQNPMNGYSLGYYWRLMPLQPYSKGDGDYTNTTAINNKQMVVIFYQLAGSGDFKVLDAFIVGIDPMYSLNEQTSPKITLVSGAKATSYENTLATIAFAGVGALILFWRRNGNN
ncbi:MAG: hypothetical protein QXQ38_04275, partial [Archaeoglobaceae archaeon]